MSRESALCSSLELGPGDTLQTRASARNVTVIGRNWGIVHFGSGITLVAVVTQMCWFVVQLLRLKKPVEKHFCFDFFFKRHPTFVSVVSLTLKSQVSAFFRAQT